MRMSLFEGEPTDSKCPNERPRGTCRTPGLNLLQSAVGIDLFPTPAGRFAKRHLSMPKSSSTTIWLSKTRARPTSKTRTQNRTDCPYPYVKAQQN
jgi:hypothetical protein